MKQLEVTDYQEYVRPSKLELALSDNSIFTITPRHSYRDKSYQMWMQLLDVYDEHPRAKKIVDEFINSKK